MKFAYLTTKHISDLVLNQESLVIYFCSLSRLPTETFPADLQMMYSLHAKHKLQQR